VEVVGSLAELLLHLLRVGGVAETGEEPLTHARLLGGAGTHNKVNN